MNVLRKLLGAWISPVPVEAQMLKECRFPGHLVLLKFIEEQMPRLLILKGHGQILIVNPHGKLLNEFSQRYLFIRHVCLLHEYRRCAHYLEIDGLSLGFSAPSFVSASMLRATKRSAASAGFFP